MQLGATVEGFYHSSFALKSRGNPTVGKFDGVRSFTEQVKRRLRPVALFNEFETRNRPNTVKRMATIRRKPKPI